MLPVLFKIGPITIHTYGFLLALGVMAAIFLAMRLAKQNNIDTKVLSDFIFYTLITGLLGAKIYLFFSEFNYYINNPSKIKEILTQAGAFYGGLIFGIIFAVWFIKKKNLDLKKIGDIAAPSIALAHFFGRLGCFSAGCCFGREAGSCAIGISFPDLHQNTGVPVGHSLYPTQLMESVLNLLNFIFLFYFYKKKKKFDGQVFVLYIFNYSVIRFFVEYFRGDHDRGYIFGGMDNPFLSLSIPQFISLIGVTIAFILYFKFRGKRETN
ncbi:MAG: prolipoprotein diacylglyceryl transferase [Acidobacteriota bacterium]